MIKVIKNAEVYAPKYLGKKQVVLVGDKVEGIYDNLQIPENFVNIIEIEGEGMILAPGFIDSHVHIMGGGGEGGFRTRTPELGLSEFIKAGITTAVGCIGTDGVTRDMRGLLAKAEALEEEGITTYCYTGSYDIPVKTITESVKSDIILIKKIIGVGEIALSDHRSSQPTYEQFTNIVAQARVGGLISGKAGVVNVHLGDGARMMDYLFNLVKTTELPPKQLLPTHINRSKKLFNVGIEYAKSGGFVDLTTSSDPDFLEEEELRAGEGLKLMLNQGVPVGNITFSSDGNGSMPIFNEKRELVGLGVCKVTSLFREVKEAVKLGVSLEDALSVVTSNVADALKLSDRGRIECGKAADLLLITKNDLTIDTVIAKGKVMMKNGEILVTGTFENRK
jgi:beta-aspartyl-dipeptidase (metallo-type)